MNAELFHRSMGGARPQSGPRVEVVGVHDPVSDVRSPVSSGLGLCTS